MRILTGDDNGLLKCTKLDSREKPRQMFKYGLQKEDHEIDNIRWSLSEERYSAFYKFLIAQGIEPSFILLE